MRGAACQGALVLSLVVPAPAVLCAEPSLLPYPPAGQADSPPSTRVERGQTCVRVTFCPTLQEQAAFSSAGLAADFVVQYDVAMEAVVGDVQVRGPGRLTEHV